MATEPKGRKRKHRNFTRRIKSGESFAATTNGATFRLWWDGKRPHVQVTGKNPRVIR